MKTTAAHTVPMTRRGFVQSGVLGQYGTMGATSVPLNDEGAPLAVFVEQMKTAVARPQTPYYPELENLMNPEMQAALDGTKTVKAALDAAVAEIDKLLAGEQ